jgi:hypothetical protein
VQLASILGMVPGYQPATRIWDGPAGETDEADPLGSAALSSELVAELRQEMRLPLAGFLYDAHGSLHATAYDAWQRLGWWVPADDAGQALRQARTYVQGLAGAQILWAGPDFPEASWIQGTITGVTAHSSGPRDAPAIDVELEKDVSGAPGLRAGRPITLLLSDIVTVTLPDADVSWLGEEGRSVPAPPQAPTRPGHIQPTAWAGDDLNPAAAVNAVDCAHYEPAADGLPALHLTPSGLLSDVLLPELLAAPLVCLAVEDPHEDCPPEHRAAGPHQHLRLHLNAGAEYGHDDCLVVSSCIGCMPHLFDAIAAHQAGWIRRYIPSGHRWVGQARFQLGNPASSRAAIETARARLTA